MKSSILILTLLFIFILILPIQAEDASPDIETEDGEGKVTFELEPETAEIIFDRRELAPGSSGPGKVLSGTYLVEISHPGYETCSFSLTVSGDTDYEITVELVPVNSILDLSGLPEGSRTFVNREEISGKEKLLSPGIYTVEVRSFGYETVSLKAELKPDERFYVEADPEPLPFTVEDFNLSGRVLVPSLAPGPGSIRGSFRVSAPGSVELTAERYDNGREDTGTVVYRTVFGPFTDNYQTFLWNGLDSTGKTVPDGEYRLLLRHRPDEGPEIIREQIVTVDSEKRSFAAPLLNGTGGLLLVPSASILPGSSFQVGSSLLSDLEEDNKNLAVTGSFAVSPVNNLELAGIGAYTALEEGEGSYLSFSFSGKYGLPAIGDLPVKWAFLLQGSMAEREAPDLLPEKRGFSAKIPFEAGFKIPSGRLTFFITPGYSYLEGEDQWESGFTTGAGVLWQSGLFNLGLSGMVYGGPLTGGTGFELEPRTGFQAGFRIPGTGVFISGAGLLRFEEEDPVFSAGGGITLLN